MKECHSIIMQKLVKIFYVYVCKGKYHLALANTFGVAKMNDQEENI